MVKTDCSTHIQDFSKQGKVSVWVSQYPYSEIPDAYFDETYSRNKARATNRWAENFRLSHFVPDNMETNGVYDGVVDIKKAAGECSFSSSYIQVLMSKARKKQLEQISWIVLLFDCEFSPKVSDVTKDDYMTFLGAFDYDDSADNLYNLE